MRAPNGSGAAVALAHLALAACADAVPAPTFTTRDSAGVRIVESERGAWGDGEAWTLSAEPSLEIGVLEGDPAYQFSSIMSSLRLEDGRIVVAERAAGQLRFFGPDGRHLLTVGGDGEGPGEFRNISQAHLYRGDSILVWDSRMDRMTVFDLEGRLGRVQSVPSPEPSGGLVAQGTGSLPVTLGGSFQGVFGDGSLVHTTTVRVLLELGTAARPEVAFMRMTPEGAAAGELGSFPGPRLGFGNSVPTPFADAFERVVGGERVYVGTGTAGIFEIDVRAGDGTRDLLIRARHRDPGVTQAHRDGYLAELRQGAEAAEEAAELERTIAAIEFPAAAPAYADLIVDSEGHLWVGDYPVPGAVGPRTWSVFDPDGRLLGDVRTPAGFTVQQIGDDFLVGVWRDELEVPYVRVYRLERR